MSNMFEAPNLLDQFRVALVKDQCGIIEFAESPKYLGRKLYPRQRTLLKIIFLEDLDDYDRKVIAEWESGMSAPGSWPQENGCQIAPKLEERIKYLKSMGAPHFRVVQLVGGRRSSKGFLTATCIAYKTFLMTQIDNVSEHYGIAKSKDVYFSIVADSLDQAKAHQFSDAYDAVLDCQAFIDRRLIGVPKAESISVNTPYDLRRLAGLRASGVKIDNSAASLHIKAFGTNSKTIRGSASIVFAFDEMAHLISGESKLSDGELWKAAIPSVNQFREDGLIFANSSPYQKTGKFYEIYEQAIELAEDQNGDKTGDPVYPDYFMLQFPSWELYRDWDDFRMLQPPAEPPEVSSIMASEERADPDAFRVEHRAQFAEVVNAFLRPEMIDRMFDPVFNEEILGNAPIPTHGAVSFMRYKGHGDPSSTGPANFGLAVGHVVEIDNKETGITEPHVVFDFIDAFYPDDFYDPDNPDQPGTIDWLQVIPQITELINDFRPFEWTFDQFDSTYPIQQLRKNISQLGVDTMVYEKTATNTDNYKRAKNFRQALNLGRIHAPHPSTYPRMSTRNPIELGQNELKFLQETKTAHGLPKVEKQSIGPVRTKDIADCLMEVVDALIGDSINADFANLSEGPVFGAQGGYGIGKGNTAKFPELDALFGRTGPQHRDDVFTPGKPIAMPGRGIRRDSSRGRY
jgi:hypothetical protein